MKFWLGLAAGVVAATMYYRNKEEVAAKLPAVPELPKLPNMPVAPVVETVTTTVTNTVAGIQQAMQKKYQPVIDDMFKNYKVTTISLFDKLSISDIALDTYGDARLWPLIVDATLKYVNTPRGIALEEQKDYYLTGEGRQVFVPPVEFLTDELADSYRARARAFEAGDIETFRLVTVTL